MHMRMVQQVLSPGMQHRQEADLGTQVLRIGRDFQQRLRSGLQQQAVEHPRILRVPGGRVRPGA